MLPRASQAEAAAGDEVHVAPEAAPAEAAHVLAKRVVELLEAVGAGLEGEDGANDVRAVLDDACVRAHEVDEAHDGAADAAQVRQGEDVEAEQDVLEELVGEKSEIATR